MIISFIIGIVLRLLNILFMFFPALSGVTSGLASALQILFAQAITWNFLFPITESFQLIYRSIQFEFAIIIFLFGKWIVELIRGK